MWDNDIQQYIQQINKMEKKITIKDIPIVENYKYLGVELNK